MTYYLGCDPGLSGGLGLIDGKGQAIDYVRMPGIAGIDEFFRGSKIISAGNVRCIFEEHHGGGEKTSAAAHESRGRYKAIIETLCHVHGIELVLVTPQTWKAHFGLIQRTPKGAPKVPVEEKRKLAKAASIALAEKMFPTINLIFPRCTVKHDGCAEALILCAFGRVKL